MKLVEEAARAMGPDRWRYIDAQEKRGCPDEYVKQERIKCLAEAAAALAVFLAALRREPSEGMVNAWEDAKPTAADYEWGAKHKTDDLDAVEWAHARANWSAMVAERVKEWGE